LRKLKKILIFRSLQLPLLENFIRKNLYKKFEIILIENNKQKFFLDKKLYNKIFYLKKKVDFKITSMSLNDIIKIRKMKIDFLLIPHKQPTLYGFENIIFFSYFLNIKQWYHLIYNDEKVNLKSLIKIKKISFNLFNLFLIKLILFPITLVLTLLFILRMITLKKL